MQALQHILQKSGYNYPKRTDMNHMTYLLLGPGILWSHGQYYIAYPNARVCYMGADWLSPKVRCTSGTVR